ncbi:MAG TPA: response regulator transcription factor [Candidatus Limnocylindria bacterium]|jgi:DNA-binding NarL/FixJ family response regulator
MRIVLVDDHSLFRDGVGALLEAWGHTVVGQAANGTEAIALVDRVRPELVLMDVRMPGLSGVETTKRIKTGQPDVAIVMLTVSEDEDDLFNAIKAGAQGYLQKNLESAQFRFMLAAVERGEAAITPATAARILDEYQHPERVRADPDRLTDREVQVLRLVTTGLRNKEIAARLGITENTAKFHLKNILEKLHAESRAELAGRAGREGLTGRVRE